VVCCVRERYEQALDRKGGSASLPGTSTRAAAAPLPPDLRSGYHGHCSTGAEDLAQGAGRRYREELGRRQGTLSGVYVERRGQLGERGREGVVGEEEEGRGQS
jgi:hypothetical protein